MIATRLHPPLSPAPSRRVPSLLQHEFHLLQLLRTRLWLGSHADLIRQVDEALSLADCPLCAEAQADGVPCQGASGDCSHCARALLRIRELRTELERQVGQADGVLSDPLDI